MTVCVVSMYQIDYSRVVAVFTTIEEARLFIASQPEPSDYSIERFTLGVPFESVAL